MGGPEIIDSVAARRLQILSTEHWSLLASRSLSYSESFSRVSMFFSVLSAAVIALALVAQAGRFDQTFIVLAILVLSIVLFVGLTTIARLAAINRDDFRWVAGMNRLRHAYLEMHPELEPYFISGLHDDVKGVLLTMGVVDEMPGARMRRDIVHGIQTLPGMLGIIVAVVAGVLASLAVSALEGSRTLAIAVGGLAAALTFVAIAVVSRRAFMRFSRSLEPRFPQHPAP